MIKQDAPQRPGPPPPGAWGDAYCRQLWAWVEHLEAENEKLMDESLEVLQQNLKQDFRIEDLAGERNRLRKDVKHLEAEIERLIEERVENSEIAYRHGWDAAKASSLKEPPTEGPEEG